MYKYVITPFSIQSRMILAIVLALGFGTIAYGNISEWVEAAGDDPEKLESTLQAAAEQGASEQSLLEARIIFPLRSGKFDNWQDLVPRVEAAADSWNYGESQLFRDRNGLDALIHAMHGRVALDAGDAASFESRVKEAFWLDPQIAGLLGPWINDYRNAARIRDLQVPLDIGLQRSSGENVTIAQLLDGKKGVLLHFWASWCPYCMGLMPTLKKEAARLEELGWVTAGLNVEGLVEAEQYREKEAIAFAWLVEPEARPYSALLRIESLPRSVLITSEGKVLFSGHLSDPKFSRALLDAESMRD